MKLNLSVIHYSLGFNTVPRERNTHIPHFNWTEYAVLPAQTISVFNQTA